MDVSSQMFPQQTGHLVEPFFVWCFLPTEKIIDFFESIKNHQLLNFEIFGVFLLGLMPYKKKCKSKTCFEMSIQKRCRSFLVNLLELRSPFEAKMMHESRYIMNILHVANLKFWNPPPNTATNAVTWTQTGCPYGIPPLRMQSSWCGSFSLCFLCFDFYVKWADEVQNFLAVCSYGSKPLTPQMPGLNFRGKIFGQARKPTESLLDLIKI